MNFAIIGAGCGGQATAGHLASKGHDVTLYDRSRSWVEPIQKHGRIQIFGAINIVGELSYVGTDLARVMENRDVVIIITTAIAHKPLARQIAPHLRDGQIVIVSPGRTFGALEVSRVIRDAGCSADVIAAETNTLLYVSRITSSGIVNVKAIKKMVLVSTIRSRHNSYLFDRLKPIFPQFVRAESFLDTSLGNIGARLHPAISLGNAERILNGDTFDFYTDGVTSRIVNVLKSIDDELMTLARSLKVKSFSIRDWLHTRYGLKKADLRAMLRSNSGYQNIKAPTTLDHRYLWDDIPTGLVPISEMAQAQNIGTPTINRLIDEGSRFLGRDFRKEGRTLEKMGLSVSGLSNELDEVANDREEAFERFYA